MNRKSVRFGQNFVTSINDINKICKKIDVNSNDVYFEIGPGKGHFTQYFVERAKEVIAIEIDSELIPILNNKFSDLDNIKIVNHDFMSYELPSTFKYKVFGNIPFNLSTSIIRKLSLEKYADEIYLIVELGFAKRLEDLNRKMGLMLAPFYEISILYNIPKRYFHPIPSVEVVLIKLKRTSYNMSMKEYIKYEDFIEKWVKKDYNVLFTKNQLKQAIRYGNIDNLRILKVEQILSIFESYKLFNGLK